MQYIISVWSAVSQLVNALIGGNPNESISGRAYRQRNDGWGWVYKLINFVFFWQDNHCKASFDVDVDESSKLLTASIQELFDEEGEEYDWEEEEEEEATNWVWTNSDYKKWWNKQSHEELMSQEVNGSNFPVRMTFDEYDHWNRKFIDDLKKYVTEWNANNGVKPRPTNGMTEE